ncbi:MAG: hypothetical protein OEY22_03100 [Candidatus Bathyarchaeota archaeon]|nr:hypothetical protein [Candidatus Bathyarchaeota archaeon]MDH5787799.1 hypothetical protein [Candidatus Bathyarchaeota archaeon]
MKMRMIKLPPDFLTETLQGKAVPFTSNLPDDIELLDIKYDLFSKQVSAIIRSDSFEDVAESYPIPEFHVIYTTNPKAESKPTTSTKPESKPTEKTPIQPSQDTSAVEKEFSPEQHELLSFTVDGEYVIVKPNQYLKTEWNEINDIVRSLGGKWVKGDSFSYWAIPLQQSQQNEF